MQGGIQNQSQTNNTQEKTAYFSIDYWIDQNTQRKCDMYGRNEHFDMEKT